MALKPTCEKLAQRAEELKNESTSYTEVQKAIDENDQMFKVLMEASMVGIFIFQDMKFTYVNPASAKIFRDSTENMLTKGPMHYTHPDYQKASEKYILSQFSDNPASKPFIFKGIRSDGEEIYCEVQGRGIEYHGKPSIIGTLVDITERKRAEEALQESEERLRNIVENSTNLFYSHTINHEITYLSPQSRDFLQTEPEEAMVRWTEFATDNPINQKGVALTKRAIKTGKRQPSYELELVGKKGRKIWVEVNEVPVVKNGKTVSIVGSLTNISERKRAEEELKRSHQTFLTVLDGIDATIYVADMETHKILFMNKYMIEAFGADLTGLICYEVFREESKPCMHCTNDRLIDANGKPAGVCVWETKNPLTGKWYINYDRAIRWMDGRIVRLQIATDISNFKKLEQERIQTEAQLWQAQKMESVGRLAGGVAHDFNNMLGVVIGRSEMMLMGMQPQDPNYQDLEEILKAAKRSADLTRQLLAFARKQTISPKVLHLNDTMEGMLKMLRRLIGEDIDLVWKPRNHLWPIKMDPVQVDQILANLSVNARDAISGTGKLTIETQNVTLDKSYCAEHRGCVPGDYVMLAISDDGCGMDKQTLEKLFEPFFTTKEVGEGTGLGLATVYGIVKQNDGFIDVQSEPGQGTEFKIYFPRTWESEESKTRAAEQTIIRGNETVLLVEDEESVLRLGEAVLKRFGYRVLTARTPGEALALAKRHQDLIHLLVTDVVMPEMNGKQLKNSIAKIKPDLKVLFMSGYTANVIVHRGILEDDVNFLQKPFTVNALAGKVREVLDQHE